MNESSSIATPITNTANVPSEIVANQPKKRGRKKGSKGVDGRLANSGLTQSSYSQHESSSFISLKNQLDSIRGSTKKVKTTHELYAELKKPNSVNALDSIGGGDGSNFGSRTSSPMMPRPTTNVDLDKIILTNTRHQFAPSPSSSSGKLIYKLYFTKIVFINFIFLVRTIRTITNKFNN